jgi:LacI family transcriptional regulator
VEGGFSEGDGEKGFEKLMKVYGQPEAIFAVTYPVGLGILNQMVKMEIDPASIPILAFGGSDFNRYLATPFICIRQPNYELGKRTFEQLKKEMEADDGITPETIELPADVSIKT